MPSTQPPFTVHPAAVPNLRRRLDALGMDGLAILAASGLDEPELIAGLRRASRSAYLDAKANAARVRGDPWFGLTLGAMTQLEDFDTWGAALLHSPDLARAIDVGAAYSHVWEEGSHRKFYDAVTSFLSEVVWPEPAK
jgi:hypothetical protein